MNIHERATSAYERALRAQRAAFDTWVRARRAQEALMEASFTAPQVIARDPVGYAKTLQEAQSLVQETERDMQETALLVAEAALYASTP